MEKRQTSILRTRLHKPPVSENLISREHLLERLSNEKEKPLILITAAAGYGKSILMSQWLDQNKEKYCWISLEEDCNDHQIIFSYLVAGIRERFVGSMQKLSQMITGDTLPPLDHILSALVEDIIELPGKLFLVFDDFHKIRNLELLGFFNLFIHNIPDNIQLAIISRTEPPLDKAKLTAYGKVCVLRMANLRLNSGEIQELAKKVFHLHLTESQAIEIESETEGWMLGVNLFLNDNFDSELSLPLTLTPGATPYLLELITKRLSNEALEMLMVASLFERFNHNLIKVILRSSFDSSISPETFDLHYRQLWQFDSSSFIISLDEDNNWNRLHHFIQEILHKQLLHTKSNEEITNYYRDASRYFCEIGSYEEGIRYSVEGQDFDQAISIIETYWEKLIDQGENLRLKRWMVMLPPGTAESSTLLLVINAYLSETFSDFESMKKYLLKASSRMETESFDDRVLGAFSSVHASMSFYTRDIPSALKYANQALKTLLPEQEYLRDYALNFWMIATNMLESEKKAENKLLDTLKSVEADYPRRIMHLHVIRLLFDWHRGKLSDLKESADIVFRICKDEEIWWVLNVGAYYQAINNYIRNHLSATLPPVDAGVTSLLRGGLSWSLQLHFTGVLAALAQSNMKMVAQYMDAAYKMVKDNKLDDFEYYVHAFEVELALRMNDMDKARKYDHTANYSMHPPVYHYYIPQLTPIKLFLHDGGNSECLDRAGLLIQDFKEKMTTINNRYALIQVTLLEAVWSYKNGQENRAIHILREAISLIRDPEYIRVFLDLGTPIKVLLESLTVKEKNKPLVGNVLKAFQFDPAPMKEELIHSELTSREAEVMHLVANGFQNKEIADKLCLSENTIKTYLYRLYKKLGVTNRTNAIRKVQLK